MSRKVLTNAYLLLYGLSILWMVALVMRRADPSGYVNKAILASGVITAVLLLFSDICLLLRRRWFSSVFWGTMTLWSAFLTWFSWFSDGSPFIQHEFHSLDLNELAVESHQFRVIAISSFFVLISWFWSYALLWHRETLRDRGITNVVTDPNHPKTQPHNPNTP